jgi:hypothetical protein
MQDDEHIGNAGHNENEQTSAEIQNVKGAPNNPAPNTQQNHPADGGRPLLLPIRISRGFWNWFSDPYRHRSNFAEKLTVAITLVIAIIGGLQYSVYRQQKGIMEDSGKQTDQLIRAANAQVFAARQIADASGRNAKAAQDFAASANSINGGIADAVGKLNSQANSANELTKQAKRTADDAENALRIQERPWVGLVGVYVADGQIGPTTMIRGIIEAPSGNYYVRIENFGRSPALHVKVNVQADVVDYVSSARERPNFPELETDLFPGVPTDSRHYPIMIHNGREWIGIVYNGDLHYYVHGNITYEDSFGCQHETVFCTHWLPGTKDEFFGCPDTNSSHVDEDQACHKEN